MVDNERYFQNMSKIIKTKRRNVIVRGAGNKQITAKKKKMQHL